MGAEGHIATYYISAIVIKFQSTLQNLVALVGKRHRRADGVPRKHL